MPSLFDEFNKLTARTPGMAQALQQIITEQTFKRGDTISAIGEMRSYLYYIITGSARVFYLSSGKEHTYSFAFEEEVISLSHPLLSNEDYLATIEFLETSKVAMVRFETFHEVLQQFDKSISVAFVKHLLKSILQHTADLEDRIVMLQTCSAPQRFHWLINRYPKILERASITQIASYLGVTKETLYRIRAGKY